jgi:thiol-disulfide isomerase/thioredoxin
MIQRVFGVIMLAAAIIIYTGYDKTLQTKLIETYPVCGVVLNSFETNPWVLEELKKLRFRQVDEASDPVKSVNHVPQPQAKTLPNLGPAPAFSELGPWINTAPLSLEGLRGQVVLIHFWTFGCINCIRTLPAVTKWYEQYREQGLVVVGIHTPEFAYERELKNVERAVKERGITYPVALDNQYATWNAYENQYWPAFYLIDATGKLRYTHFGEGRYETTEKAIENLIQEAQALPESQ